MKQKHLKLHMCCCFMDSFYPRDERPDKSAVVDTLDDGGGN